MPASAISASLGCRMGCPRALRPTVPDNLPSTAQRAARHPQPATSKRDRSLVPEASLQTSLTTRPRRRVPRKVSQGSVWCRRVASSPEPSPHWGERDRGDGDERGDDRAGGVSKTARSTRSSWCWPWRGSRAGAALAGGQDPEELLCELAEV